MAKKYKGFKGSGYDWGKRGKPSKTARHKENLKVAKAMARAVLKDMGIHNDYYC